MEAEVPIPLPKKLRHIEDADTQPLFLASKDLAAMLEHWGVTRNGTEYLRKLVRCRTLEARKVPHLRGWRFVTREVIAFYRAHIEPTSQP